MRHILIILILVCSILSATAQTNWKDFALTCGRLTELDTSGKTIQILFELGQLNAVTLGDAGESFAPYAYLKRFDNFVNYFDSAYHDTTLIRIIKNGYCPLISCYAFTALVTNRDTSIDDQMLQDLICPFAHDTNSFVYLDWGCGRNLIETFDYLMSLMTGHFRKSNFAEIKSLERGAIENLLTKRQAYYRDKDIYNRTTSWTVYKDYYLKNE